jgi:hypothetical protein
VQNIGRGLNKAGSSDITKDDEYYYYALLFFATCGFPLPVLFSSFLGIV